MQHVDVDLCVVFLVHCEFRVTADWLLSKVIGWGIDDNGVDFWIVVNSLGVNWGDKGLIRIRRGTNEVGIEEMPTAGQASNYIRTN